MSERENFPQVGRQHEAKRKVGVSLIADEMQPKQVFEKAAVNKGRPLYEIQFQELDLSGKSTQFRLVFLCVDDSVPLTNFYYSCKDF